jgi:hypothetical protein
MLMRQATLFRPACESHTFLRQSTFLRQAKLFRPAILLRSMMLLSNVLEATDNNQAGRTALKADRKCS